MKFAFPLLTTILCAAFPAIAIPVSVSVVGPDDKPLPDAKLSVSEGKLIDFSRGNARVQSGRNGVFAWEWEGQFRPIDEDSITRDFKAALDMDGLLRVQATAPGMVAETRLLKEGQTTIRLQAARAWSGVVLDQNQKPVAGVTLKLDAVQATEATKKSGAFARYLDPFLSVKATALTDAEGRWNLSGLPARGSAQFSINDERFAAQKFVLLIGEGEAAPIVLQQGATLTGVLVAPDGTPLKGEKVVGFGLGTFRITTDDEQGRFTIAGLESGEITPDLNSYSSVIPTTDGLPDFLFENSKSVQVEAGKTLDLGRIFGRKGIVIRARVVDAATKAPLAQATLVAGIGWQSRTVVGADGQLQARVLPPSTVGLSDKFEIKSEGYASYPLSLLPPKVADAAAIDLGAIEMKRGTVVRGTLAIEGGGDLSRVPTIALEQGDKTEYLRPDRTGEFQSAMLGAGTYKVRLIALVDNWQLAKPLEVVVPATGGDIAPVAILVKRLTPYEPLIKELRGKLRDAQGQPIAGAQVRARFKAEGSPYFSKVTAVSDAEGDFRFTDRLDNNVAVEWDGADHPLYLIGGAPKIEVSDGIATVSGLSAKKRGAVFSGRVTDAQGNPAAKAWIAVAQARDYPPVQADNNGKFELTDVPLDQFTLIVAHGRAWMTQAAQSDKSGITLRLPAAPAISSAESLQAQIVGIQNGVTWEDLGESWDILGTPVIERFLRRKGQPSPEAMAIFGVQLARRDPAQLLRRAPEFLRNTEGNTREDLLGQLNMVRAQSGDANERAIADQWLDEQTVVRREVNARSVTQLLQMAAVTAQLKRADAAQALDYAIGVAAQLDGDSSSQWAEPLASLGYDATAKFAAKSDARSEFILWTYVGPKLAERGDIAGARRALARLEILALDPAIINAKGADSWQVAPRRVDEMRRQLASALVPTDARAALQLALQSQDDALRARALLEIAEAAEAARNGEQSEVAEAALRETMKLPAGDGRTLARAAALGAQIRPALGAELFAAARTAALPDASERSLFSPPSIGSWAYYHAAIDPAQSRVLIEREWQWRLPAAIEAGKEISFHETDALTDLVRAMAAIDLERATAMQSAVDAAGIKRYISKTMPFHLAVIALANSEQRARLNVGLLLR